MRNSQTQWFLLSRDLLRDAKFRTLSPERSMRWLLLAMMADVDGNLPPMRQIAFELQLSGKSAQDVIDEMIKLELVEIVGPLATPIKKLRIQDWGTWLASHDRQKSTDRVRRHREKKRAEKALTHPGTGEAS